ncbi:MAG: hypothetical protein ACYDDU_17100 [Dermatophilaceae bacterium]
MTNYDMYGFYGMSVWIPSEERSEDFLLKTKLQKSRVVLRFTAGDLNAQRLELWDTGQAPHYDVVYVRADRLGTLIDAFMGAPYATMINPHDDPDGGSDR